jgi:N5-(cytidine 5'-diphosphoramidyl)-L-glutamine hydrolase
VKHVFVTQRVDVHESYQERRDALDRRWTRFLMETGVIPLPLPNDQSCAEAILRALPPDGIVLTGGNNPAAHGGEAPERDALDALLIDYAIDHGTPLIGVCRGLQSIVQFFGGSLRAVVGHVASRHRVSGAVNRFVNSYHELAVAKLPTSLQALAHSDDGSVEMVGHSVLPITGIMWHPERETAFAVGDLALFSRHWANVGGER